MAASWGPQAPIINLTDNTQSFSSTLFKIPPPDGLYYIANFGSGCSTKSDVPRPGIIRVLGQNQMDFYYKEQTTLNASIFRLVSTGPLEYIISHVRPDGTEMYCAKNDQMVWNVIDKTQLADTDRLVLIEEPSIPYTYFVKWKSDGLFCRNFTYSGLCNSTNSSMFCNDRRMADKRGDERFQFLPIFGIAANAIKTSFTANNSTVDSSNLPKRAIIDPNKQPDQIIAASATSPCIPDGLYYMFNRGNGNMSPNPFYRPGMVSSYPGEAGQVMFNGQQSTSMNASIFRFKADNTGARTNTYILSHILPDGTENFCSLKSDTRIICKDSAISSINANDRLKLIVNGTINSAFYLQWLSSNQFCRQSPGGLLPSEQTVWVCNERNIASKATDDFFQFVPIYGIDTVTSLPNTTFVPPQTTVVGGTNNPPGGTAPPGSTPGSTANAPGGPVVPPEGAGAGAGDDVSKPPGGDTPPGENGGGTVVPPGGTNNNNSVTPPVKPGATPPVVTPEGTWNSFTIALVVGVVVLVLMFVGISCVMMKG